MSDQQSEQTTETEGVENLNDALIMSASSLQSTPPTRKQRPIESCRKDKMKKVSLVMSDKDEEQQWRELFTISAKKKKQSLKTPQAKQQIQKSAKSLNKTAQVKNKKGCKFQNLCPICLCQFSIVRGSLECQHQFCFQCIQKWCESSTICPCCRKQIKSILKLVRDVPQGPVKQTKRIVVQKKTLTFQSQYDHYNCYQCGTGEDEHVLLICDQCDFYCCHVYCDQELDNVMPEGDWFCLYCRNRRRRRRQTNLTQLIQTVLESQANQTQQTESVSEDDSEGQKGVFMRTRSRNNIEINSAQRHNLATLRDFRRRIR